MPSLYLGKIGTKEQTFEIHALAKDLPFREFKSSEISDNELFNKIIQGRFELLKEGKSIYCTAVNPDLKKQVETNPHDEREGTVHIVSIDKNGEIQCSLSVAVDIGSRMNGAKIGVPLENCWKRNGFPEGASLDPFREKYMGINHGEDREIKPWEMAELYRHYKKVGQKESLAMRLGTYIGCYHLMYREAIKKSLTPTWLWVFDAIPAYFNLYRYAGAAVLRDFTIQNYPRFISPSLNEVKRININGNRYYQYKGEVISRTVEVSFLRNDNGGVEIKRKPVPFIDGVVDVKQIMGSIKAHPISLKELNYEGFTFSDRIQLLLTLSVLAKKAYGEKLGIRRLLGKKIEKFAFKKLGITTFNFDAVG